MKKILSLMLVFVLFITACGNKENGTKKENVESKDELVGKDGTLNFKKAMERDGSIAYLLVNEVVGDESGMPNKDSKVEAIVLNEGGKTSVYDTGHNRSRGLHLRKLKKNYSDKTIRQIAKDYDEFVVKRDIKNINREAERKYKNFKSDMKKGEEKSLGYKDVTNLYNSARKLKYSKPPKYKMSYYEDTHDDGESTIFMEVVPRYLGDMVDKENPDLSKYGMIQGVGSGYHFTTPLPITEVNGKKYIGYSTTDEGYGDVRMIVIEAPKGTKKVSSGLPSK